MLVPSAYSGVLLGCKWSRWSGCWCNRSATWNKLALCSFSSLLLACLARGIFFLVMQSAYPRSLGSYITFGKCLQQTLVTDPVQTRISHVFQLYQLEWDGKRCWDPSHDYYNSICVLSYLKQLVLSQTATDPLRSSSLNISMALVFHRILSFGINCTVKTDVKFKNSSVCH